MENNLEQTEKINTEFEENYNYYNNYYKGDNNYKNRQHQTTSDFMLGRFNSPCNKRSNIVVRESNVMLPAIVNEPIKKKRSRVNFVALSFTICLILALFFVASISFSNMFHYTTVFKNYSELNSAVTMTSNLNCKQANAKPTKNNYGNNKNNKTEKPASSNNAEPNNNETKTESEIANKATTKTESEVETEPTISSQIEQPEADIAPTTDTAEQEAKENEKKFKGMVIIEPISNRVLYAFNENSKLPMASTTKIATAIVAIENNTDFSSLKVVPTEAVGIEGSSIYLRKEEEISLNDLLYGLMLASGNDCATAIAILTCGSEEAFVTKMNELAVKIGLTETSFTNPHGLHSEEHFTTALDLAKLTDYAMQNEYFRKIVSTKRYTILKTNKSDERYLKNKQKLMFNEELEKSGLIISGVKSGFTPEAGRCLVTSGYKNKLNFIMTALNAPNMFDDTLNVIEKCVNLYDYYDIVQPYSYISNILVSNGKTDNVNLYSKEGFSYPLTKEEYNSVNITTSYPNEVSAPVEKDNKIGTLSVKVNNEEVFSTDILAMEEVKSNKVLDIAGELIKNF